MPDFSIIIVTWNALHHLQRFLPSVVRHSLDQSGKVEIIIADNASEDNSIAWVREAFPDVRVLRMEKNLGYCGGNNRAARQARGRNLLFLNNDVEVTPGWLNPLLQELDSRPDIAAVQPKLRSFTDQEFFDYSGAAGGLLDSLAYPFCRGRLFDSLEQDTGQYNRACDIAWASGAALAIRRDLFLQSEGFDEQFEFHMEEIDLCWQLWNKGYRIRFVPDSIVYHLGGGSMPVGSSRKMFYNYRNNLKMMLKNSSSSTVFPRILARMVLDGVALFRELFRRNPAGAGAIFRAHMHFYASLPVLFKQRKKLQEQRLLPGDERILQPYSILWHYFIRGRKTFAELPGAGN